MNEEWNNWAMAQVQARASYNRDYQEMCRSCQERHSAYLPVVGKLSREEQEIIEDYIAMCENVEYMRTQIAYEFGKEVGRRQATLTVVPNHDP